MLRDILSAVGTSCPFRILSVYCLPLRPLTLTLWMSSAAKYVCRAVVNENALASFLFSTERCVARVVLPSTIVYTSVNWFPFHSCLVVSLSCSVSSRATSSLGASTCSLCVE